MDLCSDGHDKICYDGHSCPACSLISEKADLEEQVGKKDKEIQSLNDVADALGEQIENLKKPSSN